MVGRSQYFMIFNEQAKNIQMNNSDTTQRNLTASVSPYNCSNSAELVQKLTDTS